MAKEMTDAEVFGISPKKEMSDMEVFGALQNLKAPGTLNYDQLSYAPTVGMSELERGTAGVGKSIVDTARGAGQLLGLESYGDIHNARQLDAPLMATSGGQAGNLIGDVAQAFLPAGAAKAGALGLRAAGVEIPAALARTAQYPTLTGAVQGGIYGLTRPATSAGEKAGDAALGAAGGAAIPLAINGGRLVLSAAEPFYEGGQNKIMGRVLNKVAGGDPSIGLKLQNAQEIVPGSIPTVGQAAINPGVAALEKTLVQTDPAVAYAYQQRMLDQNAARVNALRGVAGDATDMEYYQNARDQIGKKLYAKAFDKGIDESKLTPKVQDYIGTLTENPYVQDALPVAKKMAKADGVDFTSPGSLQGMHYLKLALDAQMQTGATTGLARTQLMQIGTVRDQLVGLMQKLSPDYAKAMAEYQAASAPINQMQVGQKIFNNATSAQLDSVGNPIVRPEAMAQQLKNGDRVAQQVTGFKKATLTGTLTPDQIGTLQAVASDLQRAQSANNANRVGSDTVQKLAYTNLLDQAGAPTWLRNLSPAQIGGNLGARLADMIYGPANTAIKQKFAELMLDPKNAAEAMRLYQLSQQSNGVGNLLRRVSPAGSVGTINLLNAPQ